MITTVTFWLPSLPSLFIFSLCHSPSQVFLTAANEGKRKQGIWGMDNYINGISAWTLALFTRPTSENGLGWSRKEVEVLLAGVRNDVRNTDIHAYLRV